MERAAGHSLVEEKIVAPDKVLEEYYLRVAADLALVLEFVALKFMVD